MEFCEFRSQHLVLFTEYLDFIVELLKLSIKCIVALMKFLILLK